MDKDYIDKEGNAITYAELTHLFTDKDYCRIKKTDIAHIEGNEEISVSTVWLAGQKSMSTGGPLFETMIFGGPENGWQKQYSDVEEAKRGHDFAVHLCTGMREKDKLAK